MITQKQRLGRNVSVKTRSLTGFRAWRETDGIAEGLMVVELSQEDLDRMNDIIDAIDECFYDSCRNCNWDSIESWLNEKLPDKKPIYLGDNFGHVSATDCLLRTSSRSYGVSFDGTLFYLPQDAPGLEQAIRQNVFSYFGLGWQNIL